MSARARTVGPLAGASRRAAAAAGVVAGLLVAAWLPAPVLASAVPAAPIVSCSGSSCTITGAPVAGSTYLNVYRGSTLIGIVCFFSCSITDSGLAEGSYVYKLSSVDSSTGVESAQSAGTTGTIADSTAPTVPGAFNATSGDDDVQLSWTASTDNVGVTGYRVYRDSNLQATVTGLSYDDASARNGNSYSYSVRAIDAAGNVSVPATASASAVEPTMCATRPEPYGGSDAVVSELRAIRRDLVLTCKRSHTDAVATNAALAEVTQGVDGVATSLDGLATTADRSGGYLQSISATGATGQALEDAQGSLHADLWFLGGLCTALACAYFMRRELL